MPAKRTRKPPPPAAYTDDVLLPWDRQPKEGDKAWQCFQVYRDAPHRTAAEGGPVPRTQRMVADTLYPRRSPGTNVKEISDWSVKWSWVKRAEAYDRHLDKLQQAEFQAGLKADVQAGIAVLRGMRQKAARAVLILDPAQMSAGEATRMADVAITGLRLSAGLATEIQGTERDEAFAAWLTAGDDDAPSLDDVAGV